MYHSIAWEFSTIVSPQPHTRQGTRAKSSSPREIHAAFYVELHDMQFNLRKYGIPQIVESRIKKNTTLITFSTISAVWSLILHLIGMLIVFLWFGEAYSAMSILVSPYTVDLPFELLSDSCKHFRSNYMIFVVTWHTTWLTYLNL